MLGLVIGDAASGKSEFAEDLVLKLSEKRIYAATMRNDGEESDERIQKHRRMRRGKGFITFECPQDPKQSAIEKLAEDGGFFDGACVLFEDVPNLLANRMFNGTDQPGTDILGRILYLSERSAHMVIVTGNLFTGGYDHDDTTMKYLKNLAILNRKLAEACDEVYEVTCGIPVLLKGKEI